MHDAPTPSLGGGAVPPGPSWNRQWRAQPVRNVGSQSVGSHRPHPVRPFPTKVARAARDVVCMSECVLTVFRTDSCGTMHEPCIMGHRLRIRGLPF